MGRRWQTVLPVGCTANETPPLYNCTMSSPNRKSRAINSFIATQDVAQLIPPHTQPCIYICIRGGSTPARSFAHDRSGRGCRQIDAANATVLPTGAIGNVHGGVRWSREGQGRPCTLHPAHNFKYKHVENTQWSSKSLFDAELRVFSPRGFFLCHSTYVRL